MIQHRGAAADAQALGRHEDMTEAEVLRRSVRRWRATAIVATVTLAAAAGFATYVAIDTAVSLGYARGDQEQLQRSSALLQRLALKLSTATTREELVRLLDDQSVAWFEKEGGLHAEDLGFYFDSSGTVACITSVYPAEGSPCASFAIDQP